MHNNSLIKLLRSFTPKEMYEFRDFLRSPYFNKKKSVIKLFDVLRKFYPGFAEEEMSKERIYKKLFPGKNYNDSNLRVLVHNLNELAKKFITHSSFVNNRIEYDYRQLVGLMDKQLLGNPDKMVNKLVTDLDNNSFMAHDYSYFRFRIENEYIYILSESHHGLFERFLDKADFEKVFYYLSSYYYLRSMRLYINVLNLQIIYSRNFNAEHFEKMVAGIDKRLFKKSPVIEIFYCIIKLFEKENEEKYYFRIKELFQQIKSRLHHDDIEEIYINLSNYCNRKINAGLRRFEKEKFELYKEEIVIKLYLLNGYMPVTYYKNLVILALSLKEHVWVKEFIYKYKDELPQDSRNNTYLYCKALYEFSIRNFEESLKLLSEIKFDELYLKCDSKILQIMIFYEMESAESLISSMEAFRHFLSNNKLLSETKKELYSNFHKFLAKVINFGNKNDRLELENLKQKMSDKTMSYKSWIIDKINELT